MEIEVHQIFYKEDQRPFLQPGFIPYDNSGSTPPHNFEYNVFVSNFSSGKITADLTGFVSWKFKQKTGISGEDFLSFIRSHPGHDIYFINPFPDQSCFRNVWHQGDHFHPNLSLMTKSLLHKAGYRIDLFSFENRMDTLCYCNYWVGSQAFWKRYIDFISPLYNYLSERATTEELAMLNVKADKIIEAPYSPFIFERMFSTFLALNPDLKICNYEYSPKLIQQRYPKIFPRLVSMMKAIKSNHILSYRFHRWALYFRLYGAKRFPFVHLLLGKRLKKS